VRAVLREILPWLFRLAVAPVLARAVRWSGRRAGVALVYHRLDEASGDLRRELVPAHGRRLFEAQMRHLAFYYDVVPASELPAATAGRRRGERFPVTITFDDDLASHRSVAMPALRRLKLPATFFLSGAGLSEPHSFWWERLQSAVDAGLPVATLLPAPAATAAGGAGIHELATAIGTLPPEERDAVAERLCAWAGSGPSEIGLAEEDVRELAAAGFEIGSHTLRHDYLPRLDDATLARAMIDGRDRLARIAGHQLHAIAYPHGGADRRVAAAARAAGYTTGFTTLPVAVLQGDDPLLLGRLQPSFASAGRFALRLILCLMRRRSASAEALHA
jgi:peptidoglycan/xylan/chitin deacetylase (PgdA/CDA1 family)